MRIKCLSIQDFRGFRRFEMNDLGRINLIVGTNNSGKTTVLEALSILMAHGNPSAILTVLNRRGEVIWVEHDEPAKGSTKFYEAQQLFRSFEIRVGTLFRLMADTETGVVEMIAKVSDEYRHSQLHGSPSELLHADLPPEFLTALTLSLAWSNEGSQEFHVPIDQRGLVSTAAFSLAARAVPRNGFPLQWISSSALTPDEVAALFGDVVLTPDEDMVTEAVRIIEPTIERLGSAMSRRTMSGITFPRPASTFVKLEGIKDRISMRSMGEGIWHLLSLALALVHSRNGILLIDDIDTGLHYTVMEDMWKFLDSATKTYNVQVFATTHSRDCYESLAAIAHGSVADTSEVTIQRIERGREKAVAYSEQTIVAAAKHGYEVALIMPRANPNILLVEGDEDRRVIPFLMDEYVVWGNKENEWVAEVRSHGGIEDLLESGNIKAAAMTPGREAVGIVVDADDQPDSRWARVRQCCLGIAADFPEDLPSGGLVHKNVDGLRIGVWIMPDNQSRGMLETFLSHLIVPADAPLWAFAQESCARSRNHGAPYIDTHRDKANIHTYLAWRDPPGMQLHVSVMARALHARLPLADQFAKWFIDLFQLTSR